MCCQEGRLFLIWALLCVAEHQKACKGRRDAYFSKPSQAPPRANSDPAKRRGGIQPSNGTGYGGGSEAYGAYYDDDADFMDALPPNYLARRGRAAAKPVAKPKDNTEDVFLTQVYSALNKLLPSLMDTGHPFDLEPPGRFMHPLPLQNLCFENLTLSSALISINSWQRNPEIARNLVISISVLRILTNSRPPEVLAIMLKRSPVLEKAADLLRSDSLDDMTHRYKLYEALFGFVERLANHSATARIIFGTGIVYPSDAGLLSASFNDNRYELRSSDKGKFKAETCRALSQVALQLEKPARNMLHRSKAAEEDFGTTEGKNMLSLCREICKLADFLKVNQGPSANEPSYEGKGKEPVKPQEDLFKWHQEHCVDEVPDETFSNNFYFWAEASKIPGIPPKGRMKSLMTDLATLQTSLPEGIYVRHGSSRLDMMKIIITGPNGTPYEGGLFEFDLWCSFTYPNTPPKMQFKTTGGGHAHFNPNLYTDGKVCLSLLGTWQGQPWVAAGPNKSTLLQLFISIQAMILCSEPWYNEPGREVRPNPAASVDYNRSIQTLTIPHALTSWLRHGKINDPFWKEVIEKHFRFNGQAILKSVRAWSKDAEEHIRKLPAPALPKPRIPGHLADHMEFQADFIDGYHPSLGRVAVKIPPLAKDFEKTLQSTFGIVDLGNGIVLGRHSPTGGEGKRKFGEA